MGLMDKFASVEIKTNERITEADRQFCERQQEAYDSAGWFLLNLRGLLTEEMDRQKPGDDMRYLSGGGLGLRPETVDAAICDRHKIFIHTISQYFQDTYQTTLYDNRLDARILPYEKEIQNCDKIINQPFHTGETYDESMQKKNSKIHERAEMQKKQNSELLHFSLRYDAIIDEIFLQLGGFSFEEKYIVELKNNAWKAAHDYLYNRDRQETRWNERFEVKGKTIIFYKDNSKTMIDILNALAYFETGIPRQEQNVFRNFHELSQGYLSNYVCPELNKVKGIRVFRRTKICIQFADETAAQEFAEEYLRTKINYINEEEEEALK